MIKPFYQEPSATVYCGHALDILPELPAESVDCVPTSPPYWGLRSYKTEPIIWEDNHCEHEWGKELIKAQAHHAGETNPGKEGYTKDSGQWSDKQGNFCLKCGAWKGELGLEPTIELYISHLLQIFDEVKRVLKKTGTLWVNIGDSYAGSNCGYGDYRSKNKQSLSIPEIYGDVRKPQAKSSLPAKSLCLIPERFALGMLERGWILRNVIIWYKSNPMPENVKDRFTGSYEYLYFFTKSRKYWFEQQFEKSLWYKIDKRSDGRLHPSQGKCESGEYAIGGVAYRADGQRNKRDVWEINTQPYPEAHFAVFPPYSGQFIS